LAETFNKQIKDHKLSFFLSGDNLILLLDKTGFYQLYFYLNNLSIGLNLSINKPVVTEILYRDEKFPLDIINYWYGQNFKQHLKRDIMIASLESINLPAISYSTIEIDYACLEKEVLFSEKLFRDSFDIFTGDFLSEDEIRQYIISRNILIAYYNNEMAGALQFEVKNKIVWLGHLAIDQKFRGKGIANVLVRKYIMDNQTELNTKYQLWVIQDNVAAINLYRKFGFVYGNKSTTSLLKQ
jgi:GNAT superfamily N-acetyltransferase